MCLCLWLCAFLFFHALFLQGFTVPRYRHIRMCFSGPRRCACGFVRSLSVVSPPIGVRAWVCRLHLECHDFSTRNLYLSRDLDTDVGFVTKPQHAIWIRPETFTRNMESSRILDTQFGFWAHRTCTTTAPRLLSVCHLFGFAKFVPGDVCRIHFAQSRYGTRRRRCRRSQQTGQSPQFGFVTKPRHAIWNRHETWTRNLETSTRAGAAGGAFARVPRLF